MGVVHQRVVAIPFRDAIRTYVDPETVARVWIGRWGGEVVVRTPQHTYIGLRVDARFGLCLPVETMVTTALKLADYPVGTVWWWGDSFAIHMQTIWPGFRQHERDAAGAIRRVFTGDDTLVPIRRERVDTPCAPPRRAV